VENYKAFKKFLHFRALLNSIESIPEDLKKNGFNSVIHFKKSGGSFQKLDKKLLKWEENLKKYFLKHCKNKTLSFRDYVFSKINSYKTFFSKILKDFYLNKNIEPRLSNRDQLIQRVPL